MIDNGLTRGRDGEREKKKKDASRCYLLQYRYPPNQKGKTGAGFPSFLEWYRSPACSNLRSGVWMVRCFGGELGGHPSLVEQGGQGELIERCMKTKADK